jgi:hypothetical protein
MDEDACSEPCSSRVESSVLIGRPALRFCRSTACILLHIGSVLRLSTVIPHYDRVSYLLAASSVIADSVDGDFLFSDLETTLFRPGPLLGAQTGRRPSRWDRHSGQAGAKAPGRTTSRKRCTGRGRIQPGREEGNQSKVALGIHQTCGQTCGPPFEIKAGEYSAFSFSCYFRCTSHQITSMPLFMYSSSTHPCQEVFLVGHTIGSMTTGSCRSRWNRQNCSANVQHQSCIWQGRPSASEKARLVAREAGGARRTSLDVHWKDRARKTEYITCECGKNLQGAQGQRGETIQGHTINKGRRNFPQSPSRRPLVENVGCNIVPWFGTNVRVFDPLSTFIE